MGGDGLLGLCGHDKIFCLTPGSLASLRASSVRLSSVKSQSGIPLGTTDGRGRSWIGHDHIPISPLISVGVSVSIHRPARVSLSLSLPIRSFRTGLYKNTLRTSSWQVVVEAVLGSHPAALNCCCKSRHRRVGWTTAICGHYRI